MKLKMLCLFTALLLSGCTQVEQQEAPVGESPSSLEAMDYQAEGAQIAQALQEGEFEAVVGYFNETLAQALDAENLELAWDSVVETLGDYQGETTITTNGNIVVVTERYANQNLVLSLVFDEARSLSGINLNYSPHTLTAESSDLFREEEITIQTEEHLPLGGFLTIPNQVENPPVVLLVQGSGATDRNSTINQYKPFEDLAHGLAEQGIASLRYDKRFFTYPEDVTSYGTALTMEEEILEDVATALALLETEFDDIYVLGHSLGGMLSPVIADRHPVVKGIISMAGSPQPLYEISYAQNKAIEASVAEMDLDQETLDEFVAQMEIVEEDIIILRHDFSPLASDEILMGLPVAYQQAAKDLAGEQFIGDLEIPILILQGEDDIQVSATVDFLLYQELLVDNEKASFHLYEGLNHLMMPEEEVHIPNYVIDDIVAFIQGAE